FVLGQMQKESSIPFLKESLEDTEENEMVRHECAEALGSVATEECTVILNKYLDDPKRVVRESCIIALDMCEYQMQDENAIDVLISVLEDVTQEPMVRHEAAEALGAIGSVKSLEYLEKYKNNPIKEVAETCELALERIQWLKNSNQETEPLSKSPYNSVDPAPPALTNDIEELRQILTDEKISLFNRYRAMFALRNIGTKEAINVLGEALKCGSALFKHEIAFVLGQMQKESSIPFLKESLEDTEENEMVRHECAE
nr:nero [Cucujiformia]